MSAEDYRRTAQQYLIRAYRVSNLVTKTMMLDLTEHWLRRAEEAERAEQADQKKELAAVEYEQLAKKAEE
jgi:hypothetical protein